MFPIRGKECSSEQTPFLNSKIKSYKQFAESNLETIYGKDKLDSALHLQINTMASYVVINQGVDGFEYKELPVRAQFGPILDWTVLDVDKDEIGEVFAIGSDIHAEVETIKYDAFQGCILKWTGDDFNVISQPSYISKKAVKAMKKITIKDEIYLILLHPNSKLSFLKL